MDKERTVSFVDKKVFNWAFDISLLAQEEAKPKLTFAYLMEKLVSKQGIFFTSPSGTGVGFVEVHLVGEKYVQLVNLFIGKDHLTNLPPVGALKYAVGEVHKAHPEKKVFSIFKYPDDLETIKELFAAGVVKIHEADLANIPWSHIVFEDEDQTYAALVVDLDVLGHQDKV